MGKNGFSLAELCFMSRQIVVGASCPVNRTKVNVAYLGVSRLFATTCCDWFKHVTFKMKCYGF